MHDVKSEALAFSSGSERLADQLLTDPVNEALISALWHSSVPLSAARFVDEYSKSPRNISVVSAHLRQLAAADIINSAGSEAGVVSYVLGGANCGEAIRRLGLSRDKP